MNYKSYFLTLLALLVACHYGFSQRAYLQEDNISIEAVTSDAQINTLTIGQIQTVRTYLDGLGRPIQAIALNAGANNSNDIVQPMQYDNLGRQTKQYLPYVGASSGGGFRTAAASEQLSYYSSAFGDSSPFSAQIFDNSPLQRLLGTGSPGDGYQPISGQHYKTVSYRNNTVADNVLIFSPAGSYTSGYAANLLSVIDGKDEDGVETIAFNDLQGRTILKRQVTGNATTPFLDTYYVYNGDGTIAYIITPKGVSTILASSTTLAFNSSPLKSLIYKYLYDTRGRLIQKITPTSGAISIIYDPLNRPVLVQDEDMRVAKNWVYIKYDSKGRAISRGLYNDLTHLNPADMQTYVNGLASSYTTAWCESRSSSATNKYYTNAVFPSTGITPLAFSFYDDYDLYQNGTAAYSYTSQGLTPEPVQTLAAVKSAPTMTLKRTTGSGLSSIWLIKVMFYDKRGNLIQTKSNNQLNYTTQENTTDTKTAVQDFVGRTRQQLAVTITGAGTSGTNKVLTTFNYDSHNARIASIVQQYNSQPAVTIAVYAYNELGQLVTKNLGLTTAGSIPATQNLNTTYSGNNVVNATNSITMSNGFSVPSGSTFTAAIINNYLQTLTYAYNIRGQLLSMNSSQLTGTYSSAVFGMQLLYNTQDANLGNVPVFNGKISAVKWMSKNITGTNSNERSYKYSYDQLDRLTSSAYAERVASTGPFGTNVDGYTENGINYDENGNLNAMARNSLVSGATAQVDNLSYTYAATNPDSLLKVTDGTGTNYTGVGFRNLTGSTGNYTYTVKGNLTADPYKGLAISYNILNKTDKITVTTSPNRWIDYTYDADGGVLRKRVYDNNSLLSTTDYINGMAYVNATLSYFGMPEGRVVNNSGTLSPEYTIVDQQGNARVGFNNTGTGGAVKVVQENSYSGFGLILANSPVSGGSNKNLYNGGSEWQNDYNNLPDYYQTLYRNYDAAIGRFTGTDPQPESSANMTPYNYAGNNPVMMNDPLGNYPVPRNQPPINWDAFREPFLWHLTGGSNMGEDDDEGGGGTGFASADDFWNALVKLNSSEFGGFANGNGIHYFTGAYQEMKFGFIQMQALNLVGSPLLPGSATSFAQAIYRYDTDPKMTGPAYTLNGSTYATQRMISANGFAWNDKDENGNSKVIDGTSARGVLDGTTVSDGKESWFDKVLDAADRGGTYTEAIAFASKHADIAEFTGEKVFALTTNLVGLVVIGSDAVKSYNAFKSGNWREGSWQALKAVGTGAFMYFGGAEYQGAKLLWNLGALIIDDSRPSH